MDTILFIQLLITAVLSALCGSSVTYAIVMCHKHVDTDDESVNTLQPSDVIKINGVVCTVEDLHRVLGVSETTHLVDFCHSSVPVDCDTFTWTNLRFKTAAVESFSIEVDGGLKLSAVHTCNQKYDITIKQSDMFDGDATIHECTKITINGTTRNVAELIRHLGTQTAMTLISNVYAYIRTGSSIPRYIWLSTMTPCDELQSFTIDICGYKKLTATRDNRSTLSTSNKYTISIADSTEPDLNIAALALRDSTIVKVPTNVFKIWDKNEIYSGPRIQL